MARQAPATELVLVLLLLPLSDEMNTADVFSSGFVLLLRAPPVEPDHGTAILPLLVWSTRCQLRPLHFLFVFGGFAAALLPWSSALISKRRLLRHHRHFRMRFRVSSLPPPTRSMIEGIPRFG